jgi:hypothetical protein
MFVKLKIIEMLSVEKDFFYYFSGEKCLTAHSLEPASLLMKTKMQN